MKSGYTIVLNYNQLIALYECLLSAQSWHSTLINSEKDSIRSAILRNDAKFREISESLLKSYERNQKQNVKLSESVEWLLRSLKSGNTVLDIKEEEFNDD